ncbi:hypothetical protein GCM10007862_17250 [Dyella lipolytica]|uniref:Secreted protein n=1 Tax=Dyella lipolytica TaxID=1867835 RepID=A0ABW8IUI9_9GAMM|nr:hypothetical protein [Dyella lipolytica]GLQ46674.1 hypothetical protein GCM10007862_17250 [Dyella lipolytica]
MQAKLKFVFAVGLLSAACAPAAFAADDGILEQAAKASWRHDIAQIATPAEGCFKATYPSVLWEPTACHQLAPRAHTVPRQIVFGQEQTTGNGVDYTLDSTNVISKAVGSFPTFSGVTSEQGVNVPFGSGESNGIIGPNEYSLQMNTSFNSTTAACNGHSGCVVWQQFIYAPDYEVQGQGAVFIQDWLIGYGGRRCPSGFGSDGAGDCYKNSAATSMADIPGTALGSVTLTGTAVTGGNDTTVVTYNGNAYSTSQKDSTLDIASVWKEVEYNVVGNAGGSQAQFNSGSTIGVNIAVTNGSTAAPTCQANNGSTGETNNLNLGSCTASAGSTPSVSFTESN